MNNPAREAILSSIRSHLAASVPYDKQEVSHGFTRIDTDHNPRSSVDICGQFKTSLEAVDGHCVIARAIRRLPRSSLRSSARFDKHTSPFPITLRWNDYFS